MKGEPTVQDISIAIRVLRKLDRRIGIGASVACENAQKKFFSGLREQHITARAQEQIQAVITVVEEVCQWSLELANPDIECVADDGEAQIFGEEQNDSEDQ